MTKLSKAQQEALDLLSPTTPKSAYDLRVSLPTLQALVAKGVARDVTPSGPGGMFSPRTYFKFIRAVPATAAMPPEHEFVGKTVDEWEEIVVRRAEYFVATRSLHDGRLDTHKFKSLGEAIELGKTDRRYMVAAVAPTGRFATLDRRKWDHFLQVYKTRDKFTYTSEDLKGLKFSKR